MSVLRVDIVGRVCNDYHMNKKERQVVNMTNLNSIKCNESCYHGLDQVGFSKIYDTKWHQCRVCNRWQVRNWIMRHQMHCEISVRNRD